MSSRTLLEKLWNSTQPSNRIFEPERMLEYPDPVIRYLKHAIAPGIPLARAVHLQMHGEIKLKKWLPYKAEQIIHIERGMIWRATAWMSGIPIRGADRMIDGEGSMIWKILGIIPVMKASGPDITRSAAGRLQGEFVWLPSYFLLGDVKWIAQDSLHVKARLSVAGFTETVSFVFNDIGRLLNISLSRWGNPEGNNFGLYDFGAEVLEERTFGGYTIPSKISAGWYFGTDRFEESGEFFRCTIDAAEFR